MYIQLTAGTMSDYDKSFSAVGMTGGGIDPAVTDAFANNFTFLDIDEGDREEEEFEGEENSGINDSPQSNDSTGPADISPFYSEVYHSASDVDYTSSDNDTQSDEPLSGHTKPPSKKKSWFKPFNHIRRRRDKGKTSVPGRHDKGRTSVPDTAPSQEALHPQSKQRRPTTYKSKAENILGTELTDEELYASDLVRTKYSSLKPAKRPEGDTSWLDSGTSRADDHTGMPWSQVVEDAQGKAATEDDGPEK